MESSTVIEQPGFTIYWKDLKKYLECFSDREIGCILRALYAAVMESGEPELRHAEKPPFLHLKKNVLLQEKRYRETKKQNRRNGSKGEKKPVRKRPAPAVCGRKPTQTQTVTFSSEKEGPPLQTETGRGENIRGK